MIARSDIRRILVSRLRFLGDVVLTTPLLRALRQSFPQAHLAYLVEKPYSHILEQNSCLDEIQILEKKEIASLPLTRRAFAHAGFIRKLRRENYDLAIDLLGNPRSGLLTLLTGAKYRLGPARRGRMACYTHVVTEPDEPHNQIETHLEFLKPLGIDPGKVSRITEVLITSQEREWALSYCAQKHLSARPLVILHPGASWPAKRGLPETFAQTSERLKRDLNASVVLLCGPEEQPVISAVLQATKQKAPVAEGLTIRQLAALLSICDLFITNDAGPMHIACALGKPTIALFGPGEPETWFPYREEEKQIAIHHPPSCWPCHRDHCDKMDCMKGISVEEIVTKALQLVPDNLHRTSPSSKVPCLI